MESIENIDFCLKDQDDHLHCLKYFKGKWVVLYFYPRDNTSGCTKEALDFTTNINEFNKLNVITIGISKDSTQSHKRFIKKNNLQILLLSDPEHKVIEQFGAWEEKKNYGKTYYGTIRSTFLISPEGKIVKSWKKVKVKGHVNEVLTTLKELQQKNK